MRVPRLQFGGVLHTDDALIGGYIAECGRQESGLSGAGASRDQKRQARTAEETKAADELGQLGSSALAAVDSRSAADYFRRAVALAKDDPAPWIGLRVVDRGDDRGRSGCRRRRFWREGHRPTVAQALTMRRARVRRGTPAATMDRGPWDRARPNAETRWPSSSSCS